MGDKFYAVAHGRKPGVYEEWANAQKQIKDYPQPVYKKFATRDEAEEFVKARQHERVSMQVEESAKKFYAVARGKVIGIFTEFNEVKKHIADYPQPMYKKFGGLAEAREYFKKYSGCEDTTECSKVGNGDDDLSTEEKEKEQKKSCAREDVKHKNTSKDKDESKEKVYYAVARGHRPGVYKSWAECQEQTKDFKGAKFKKFTEEDEAKFFAEGNTLKQIGAQVLSSLTR
uniref:ribonuclease H n=2 Tax=Parascaris univalens TaxID=6257 RepID=A0A915AJK4_PARUN